MAKIIIVASTYMQSWNLVILLHDHKAVSYVGVLILDSSNHIRLEALNTIEITSTKT